MSSHPLEPALKAFLERDRPDRFAFRGGQPNVAEVFHHARNNSTIAAIVDAWKHGGFRSWEEAMTACVCYLAQQNASLMRDAVRRPIDFVAVSDQLVADVAKSFGVPAHIVSPDATKSETASVAVAPLTCAICRNPHSRTDHTLCSTCEADMLS